MNRTVDRRNRAGHEPRAQSESSLTDRTPNPEAKGAGALTVMDASDIARAIRRLAHEIDERNDAETLALVGVFRRGVALAQRLRGLLTEMGRDEISVGILDISLYRDDGRGEGGDPQLLGRSIPFSLSSRTVVLVDDVLYTGRTVRAALQALTELGRPRSIQLAVLVDRGERELPIRADYVGKNVKAGPAQRVYVRLREVDGIDAVIVGPSTKYAQRMVSYPRTI
jgi:pyrimidine operon attenuation protein/uracil phosphoribosyltransferase